MHRLLVVPVTLLLTAALPACGQKGPLYLPGDPSDVQTEIPEVDPDLFPAPDEDDDADDEDDGEAADDH